MTGRLKFLPWTRAAPMRPLPGPGAGYAGLAVLASPVLNHSFSFVFIYILNEMQIDAFSSPQDTISALDGNKRWLETLWPTRVLQ